MYSLYHTVQFNNFTYIILGKATKFIVVGVNDSILGCIYGKDCETVYIVYVGSTGNFLVTRRTMMVTSCPNVLVGPIRCNQEEERTCFINKAVCKNW
jgi:hypothetical protein